MPTIASDFRRCLPAVLLALAIGSILRAADPPNVWISVRKGAAPGEQFKLTVGGKGLAAESRLWTTFSDPQSLATTPADNGKNDGFCTYDVTVPKTAALGIHAIRIVTPNGTSLPIPFVIDDLPTVEKVAGNQTFAKAQELKIPTAVDGKIENLTRDYYRFKATAGQTVSFEAFARRIGSPIDASLYLYDAKGRILAYCDDAEGLSSDPQLVYTFAKDGEYVVEIRDIRYSGGDLFFYHLRIGDFPCIQTAFPLAVKRGVETRIDFAGISCDDAAPAIVNVPADWRENWYPVSCRRASGIGSAFATVAVVDTTEVVDREPNNNRPQAQQIELGGAISGRFDAPGDVDLFSFHAQAGQRWQFTGMTREIGTPSDLTFKMLNAQGASIATADDNGTAEGVLDVTFPADGVYTLELTDLNKRGGPQYSYRIVPSQYRPGFSLTANTDTLNIPAGGSASMTITAVRRDYAGPIEATVEGLPPESARPIFLGPGVNSVTGSISTAAPSAPLNLARISITGKAKIGDADFETKATLVDALRTRWSGVTQVPPRFATSESVAITAAPNVSLKFDPPELTLGPGLKTTVKVIATRAAGFDQAIKLTTLPEKDGLPANIAVELKPIDKGANEVTLTVSANEKAAKGPFSIALNGVHEKDKVSTAAVSPNLTLRLNDAFQLTAAPTATPMLVRGAQLKFKVTVTRNPAYSGEIKLTCEKLPGGVTAPEVVLKADQSEAELVLAAAADAPAAATTAVELRAYSPADAKISSTISLPLFSVQ